MKSIMQEYKGCYVCGNTQYVEEHHIFYGGRNRNKTEKDGLKVFLCYEHHRGTDGVHGKNGHELDTQLKQEAERIWIKYYNKTIEDFIKRYGKNYL